MTTDLTEEEVRQALFGSELGALHVSDAPEQEDLLAAAVRRTAPPAKRKNPKGFTPRLRVTLRVGNEFEGETKLIVHEANALSKSKPKECLSGKRPIDLLFTTAGARHVERMLVRITEGFAF